MNYNDKLIKIIAAGKSKHSYRFLNKLLNKSFNGINHGEYVLVTGLPSTGKRSFVDSFYLLDILRQWDAKEEEERLLEPLKIVYFSAKYDEGSKMMKWASYLYTKAMKRIMDVPTLTGGAGRLYKINKNREEYVLKNFELINRAVEEDVLEVISSNVTPLSIERRLNSLLHDRGSVEYNDHGEMTFVPDEDAERGLTIIIVDDIDNVKSSESSFGEGMMNEVEKIKDLNSTFKKYSSLGLTIVAIKGTEPVQRYVQYIPSAKELKGLSPNKAIVIFNPFQERYANHLQFDTLKFVDEYNVNRLRFAYISYNETGVSNMHIPLLFMPENGIFGELRLINTEEDEDRNLSKFDEFVKIRKTF